MNTIFRTLSAIMLLALSGMALPGYSYTYTPHGYEGRTHNRCAHAVLYRIDQELEKIKKAEGIDLITQTPQLELEGNRLSGAPIYKYPLAFKSNGRLAGQIVIRATPNICQLRILEFERFW